MNAIGVSLSVHEEATDTLGVVLWVHEEYALPLLMVLGVYGEVIRYGERLTKRQRLGGRFLRAGG